MSNIGVFPAAGGLGSSIVKHLLNLVPASQLVLIARKPESLSKEAAAGATVRHADYDDPATLDHAFDGVDVLMLISYASFEIEHRFNVPLILPHFTMIASANKYRRTKKPSTRRRSPA